MHSMCTSMPWWMPWSCSVRIISRPVRSPTCARRGYLWPPKLRWRMRPSVVRSNSAPHASSSRTRSGASLRVQLGHAPVVEVLAAAHRVGEVDPPVVAIVDVGQRRRHAAFGHHRVRLAEQRLADEADRDAGGRGFDRRAQARAAGADDEHVVIAALATCDVLNLVLGPLHLDLLGLVVDLNQVVLNITGQNRGIFSAIWCALLPVCWTEAWAARLGKSWRC